MNMYKIFICFVYVFLIHEASFKIVIRCSTTVDRNITADTANQLYGIFGQQQENVALKGECFLSNKKKKIPNKKQTNRQTFNSEYINGLLCIYRNNLTIEKYIDEIKNYINEKYNNIGEYRSIYEMKNALLILSDLLLKYNIDSIDTVVTHIERINNIVKKYLMSFKNYFCNFTRKRVFNSNFKKYFDNIGKFANENNLSSVITSLADIANAFTSFRYKRYILKFLYSSNDIGYYFDVLKNILEKILNGNEKQFKNLICGYIFGWFAIGKLLLNGIESCDLKGNNDNLLGLFKNSKHKQSVEEYITKKLNVSANQQS